MAHKILIAEDNLVNQKVMRGVLAKAGYQSDTVADGEEAVKACQNNAYDLVLMDVQMPILDGLSATRAIRKLDIAQPTIIAVTARALQDDRAECIKSGMNDYVSKPFQPDLLLDRIRLVLQHRVSESFAVYSA